MALVRYPPRRRTNTPTQPEHVARRLPPASRCRYAWYDPSESFSWATTAGAQLAGLLALEARYLRDAGAPLAAIAGVIGIGGVYDLTATGALAALAPAELAPAFGADAATLRLASPMTHVRRTVPFLILAGENDFNGFQSEARKFAARLRAAGNSAVQQFVIKDKDHFSVLNIGGGRNFVGDLILSFVGKQPLPPAVDALTRARRAWQEPAVSTESSGIQDLIRHTVDDAFAFALRKISK